MTKKSRKPNKPAEPKKPLSEAQVWRLIAKAFRNPSINRFMTSAGLCNAISCMHNFSIVHEPTLRRMRQRLFKFHPHASAYLWRTGTNYKKRAALAEQFAKQAQRDARKHPTNQPREPSCGHL